MNRARLPLNGIAFRGWYGKRSAPSWGVAFPTGPGPSFQDLQLLPALLPQAHPASLFPLLGLGTQTSARWRSSLTQSLLKPSQEVQVRRRTSAPSPRAGLLLLGTPASLSPIAHPTELCLWKPGAGQTSHRLCSRPAPHPVLPLISCVSVGRVLHLSVSLFREKGVAVIPALLGGLNESRISLRDACPRIF